MMTWRDYNHVTMIPTVAAYKESDLTLINDDKKNIYWN